jgi:cbb3-type cytochrome oxidase maturation protein
MTLLFIWLSYTFFGVTFFSLVFWWAVRTRQFSDPARSARLVVEDLPPEGTPPAARRAWRALVGPLLAASVAAVILGGTAVYIFTR